MSLADFEFKDTYWADPSMFDERNEVVTGLWLSALPSEIPPDVKYVFSMIGPQPYSLAPHQKVTSVHFEDEPKMPNEAMIHALADAVNLARLDGTVLVHCYAGLNRSALVLGLALVKSGMSPEKAIAWMRMRRGPDVLHNKTFHDWLLKQG